MIPKGTGPEQMRLASITLTVFCVLVTVASAGKWMKYARERLQNFNVSVVGWKTSCEILVSSTNESIRLVGIEPIRVREDTDPQYVLGLVEAFVRSPQSRSHAEHFPSVAVKQRKGDSAGWFYGSVYFGSLSLQEILVNEGYAAAATNAPQHMLTACDLAMQERRGLWMLAKPWPTEFAWWTKYVQDNVTSNTFDAATAPQVDLIVLIGHRRRGSSFYPLAPFVITRDHMVKSSDLPGLSNHGFTIASDALVDHICGHVSPTNTFRSETWAAVLSSSNHVIRGYAAFGADLWDKAPATGNESVTNMIRFIPQYLDTAK